MEYFFEWNVIYTNYSFINQTYVLRQIPYLYWSAANPGTGRVRGSIEQEIAFEAQSLFSSAGCERPESGSGERMRRLDEALQAQFKLRSTLIPMPCNVVI